MERSQKSCISLYYRRHVDWPLSLFGIPYRNMICFLDRQVGRGEKKQDISSAVHCCSSLCSKNCWYYGSGVENRNRSSSLLAFGYTNKVKMAAKEVMYAAH